MHIVADSVCSLQLYKKGNARLMADSCKKNY